MTTRDEPLPTDEPTQPEIEEISDDLIIVPGETLPGAVMGPGAEPSETTLSRTAEEPRHPPSEPEPPAEEPVATPPEPKPRPAAQSRPVARLTPARPVAKQAAPAQPRTPSPAPAPRSERLDEASTRVVVVPRETAPRRFPLLVALIFLSCGFGAGFFAGRLWEQRAAATVAAPAAAAPADHEAAAEPSHGEDDRGPVPAPRRTAKPARAAQPAKAARTQAPSAKGKLDVTAPAGAEIFLDGKRIGRGSLKVDVAAGRHRVEVRLGKNRVSETFEAEPGITWTYEVTPK